MGRRWSWVAWSMLAIFVAGCGSAVTLLVARRGGFGQEGVTLPLAFTGFMVVGAVIVARRPANAIGWIFSAVGLLAATGWLAMEYAAYAYLTRPGSLPGASWVAWYQQQWWTPMLALIAIATPLLFPTGRLPSARWRPVAAVAALVTVALELLFAFRPTIRLQDPNYEVDNPIGLAWIPDPDTSAVGGALFGVLTACLVAAVVSLVLRFRRSRGLERQQLKWFTYAGVLLVLGGPLASYLLPSSVSDVTFGLVIALVPVAAGIAILRYRLYDIDRLINRTLVYGTLTAVLGCCYVAGSLVFVLVAGAGSDPPGWLIAAATLTAAAVFRPARRRIQAAVDRRFNRRRYNATKTIQAFSARLRDQIDLDTLSAELLAVVDQTMEPTSVSLWLRPTGATAQAPGRHG